MIDDDTTDQCFVFYHGFDDCLGDRLIRLMEISRKFPSYKLYVLEDPNGEEWDKRTVFVLASSQKEAAEFYNNFNDADLVASRFKEYK